MGDMPVLLREFLRLAGWVAFVWAVGGTLTLVADAGRVMPRDELYRMVCAGAMFYAWWRFK